MGKQTEIWGYSERGVMNSFFYEISFSNNSLQILNGFLGQCFKPKRVFEMEKAEIIIEQTFSGFGDSDAVIFAREAGKEMAFFIEAKVKTDSRKNYNIKKIMEFVRNGEVNASNLFVQLLSKQKLCEYLPRYLSALSTAEKNGKKKVEESEGFKIVYKGNSSGEASKFVKLGSNTVVRRVAKKLGGIDEAFFISIVPACAEAVRQNFIQLLDDKTIRNWGFIEWPDVEDLCHKNHFFRTINCFDQNKGQIY